ncbi:MAG: hypothetical protein RL398_1495 [Planctomycetota bacterium]|jgi:hypothetical protein
MNATRLSLFAAALSVALCSAVPEAAATDRLPAGHPDPEDFFTSSEQCGVCHTVAPAANAMRNATGDDVSPYSLWQGTMMANSFRDPYFRAQLRKETVAAGEDVQALCLRCHAPMMSHGLALSGQPRPKLAEVEHDTFADDGVSCTVCHMISDEKLGQEESFSGNPHFNKERRIYGPFADVAIGPMRNMVNYIPTQGTHIRKSALCATCHTLYTEHHGTPFPEQTPYLEWRNSEFSDEPAREDTSRTCQECHMPETGPTRIARNPMGFDFLIPAREGYRGHAFVGGNAFMLRLLDANREELDVIAESEALQRMATATKRQLAEQTASLFVSDVARKDGNLEFSIRVENKTGHKFPTGYPSRRAWLSVQVRQGRTLVFESGAFDDKGRIVGLGDELGQPHRNLVEKPEDVVIYEMVAHDPDGAATTHLTKMVHRAKDNRLLPRGWRDDGPHVADTKPMGLGDDADFVGGSDTVQFRIPAPKGQGRVQVVARLHYQTVPPAWVDALRGIDADETNRFVRMYDAADKTPETVAVGVGSER